MVVSRRTTRLPGLLIPTILALAGCRPGSPCAENCDEGQPDSEYTVECVDVATWASGSINHVESVEDGSILVGQRKLSQGDALTTWVGKIDGAGALQWELELQGTGSANDVVAADDGVRVLHRQSSSASVISQVDASGNFVATVPLTNGGEPLIAAALIDVSGSTYVGGLKEFDFWLARVAPHGEVESFTTQDYAGFTDILVGFIPTPEGFAAIVHAGTTPGVIDGDIMVLEALDTLVIFFDADANELHREVFSHTDEFTSMGASAAMGLDDGSVIVVGQQSPTLETGDQTAWAARLSAAGVTWLREWSGPSDHATAHALATLQAVRRVDEEVVVAAGRQATSGGHARWHVLLDIDDGTDVEEQIGEAPGGFDSYLGAGTDGPAWVAGSSALSEERVQWACLFEKNP